MKAQTLNQIRERKEIEDFGSKWVGRKCLIILNDNSTVRVKVTNDSKFYIEGTDVGTNKTMYIRKEYIKKLIIEE